MKDLNNKQIEKVFENISKEEINNILEKLDLKLEEAEEISGEGFISEIERNRFNSNFEFFEGSKVSKDNILKLIEVAKNNLEDVRVTKYKEMKNNEKDKEPEPEEYKLTIKKNKYNESLANDLTTNIKNSKDNEYDVRIEYSQKTGLVENIFITVSKQRDKIDKRLKNLYRFLVFLNYINIEYKYSEKKNKKLQKKY